MNEAMNSGLLLMQNPSKFLGDLLVERKSKNPRYSARAMARDLGISVSFLSQLIGKTRNPSLEQKLKLADALGISAHRLLPGAHRPVKNKNTKTKIDLIQNTIEHEKILKYWYHFAILEMTVTGKIKNEPKLLGRRLGISELECKTAVARLIEFGYLEEATQGELKKTKLPFMIKIKSAGTTIREYHSSRLKAADLELSDTQESRVDSRYFQTLFVPTSRAKVTRAKEMIAEFQNKLINFLVEEKDYGKNDEVFQLGLQLFSAEKRKE